MSRDNEKSDKKTGLQAAFIEQRTDDVESLFAGATGEGWEYDPLQLTRGPLRACVRQVSLPQIDIVWCDYGAGLHMREFHQQDAVYITFLLDASATAKWYGREVNADEALIFFPREEQDYVLAPDTRALGFMIGHSCLLAMGLGLEKTPFQTIKPAVRDKVVALSEEITALARSGRIQSHEQALVLQEQLMLGLVDLLMPWVIDTSGRDEKAKLLDRCFLLIEKARQYMLAHDPAQKLNVAAMARCLGTSSRTLYRAFTRYLGMGPYEYFTLLRLQTFRQHIRNGEASHGAITDAAISAGFSHMGRFSRMYREYYGERPRDTLQRWV